MSKRGRYERKKVKKPVTVGRVLAIILGVVLTLVLVAGVAGWIYYNHMLDMLTIVEVPEIVYTEETTEPVETTAPVAETEATEATEVTTEPVHVPSSEDYINFLVVGQAARAGESKDSERMADTMILVTLNTYEKTLTMTSILRDSLVRPPDYLGHQFGPIKLNTVYHLGSHYEGSVAGSMELINRTLYNNFGIEVDHNIEVSFDAFVAVINTIGGIDIELTQAEADYMNDDDVWVKKEMKEGVNTLWGMSALSYVRMRKAEGDNESDIRRTERQRKFIEAVLNKLKGVSLTRLQKVAETALPMVITSMSKDEITDALLTLLPMLPELTIQKGGVCPTEGWGDEVEIYKDGVWHSVMRFVPEVEKRNMRAITEGEFAD